MTCGEVQELLSPFFDHELDANRSKCVANHIATCTECSQILTGYQKLSNFIQLRAEFQLPARLRNRLESQLREFTASDEDDYDAGTNSLFSRLRSANVPEVFEPNQTCWGERESLRILFEHDAVISSDPASERASEAIEFFDEDAVPEEIRLALHTSGPVMFPDASIGDGAWEFGLLNEFSSEKTDWLVERIANRAFEKLRPTLGTIAAIVMVCFGWPVHRCGMRLSAKIRSTYGTHIHVVLADDYVNPMLVCNPDELTDQHVILFVDVVHTGSLLTRLRQACMEAAPKEISACVIIDQAPEGMPGCRHLSLWKESREPRTNCMEAQYQGTSDIRCFDPDSCRATAEIPEEVVNIDAACRTVEGCIKDLAPIWPAINQLGALRPDDVVNNVRYPWIIDDLALHRHADAGPELIRRATHCLRKVGDDKPWCLVYPAERSKRAGAWAHSLGRELGWSIMAIGHTDHSHFRGLSEERREQLASVGRVVVVDAVFRTGKTLQSLAHLLRGGAEPIVQTLVAFYVFDGSFRHVRASVEQDLRIPIHTLFRIPLGPASDSVGECWRNRMAMTLAQLPPAESADREPTWTRTLREYCADKFKPHPQKPGRIPDPATELRHALAEEQEGPRARLNRICTEPKTGILKHLDRRYVLQIPSVRNTLHGFVCNSMPPRIVEASALALATQDDYAWLEYPWLVLHSEFFSKNTQHWRFVVLIVHWIRQTGNAELIDRTRTAFEEFRTYRQPDSVYVDPLLESRCTEVLGVLSA